MALLSTPSSFSVKICLGFFFRADFQAIHSFDKILWKILRMLQRFFSYFLHFFLSFWRFLHFFLLFFEEEKEKEEEEEEEEEEAVVTNERAIATATNKR